MSPAEQPTSPLDETLQWWAALPPVGQGRVRHMGSTHDNPLIQAPLSYVVVDEAEIRRKVAALLGP